MGLYSTCCCILFVEHSTHWLGDDQRIRVRYCLREMSYLLLAVVRHMYAVVTVEGGVRAHIIFTAYYGLALLSTISVQVRAPFFFFLPLLIASRSASHFDRVLRVLLRASHSTLSFLCLVSLCLSLPLLSSSLPKPPTGRPGVLSGRGIIHRLPCERSLRGLLRLPPPERRSR